MTAFLDRPTASFDTSVAFWQAVTASGLSAPRGEQGEFATLLPAHGDAYLRVQRVLEGAGGSHLDVHVDDVAATAARFAALGAHVQHDGGYVTMVSPAGIVFCVVPHHGQAVRPAPVTDGAARSLVDQLSLDVPDVHFDAEAGFWVAATGWERHHGAMAEFVVLARPAGQPLRLLLQRLGADDRGGGRAHLDLACGADVEVVAARHVALGATIVRTTPYWTTLADPAGLPYCLTRRDADTGTLPPS